MRRGWLAWKRDRLWLVGDGEESLLRGPGDLDRAASEGLAFAIDRFGLIAFRASEGLSCWRSESDDPSTFHPLPPLPAKSPASTDVGLHPRHGSVSVLLGRTFHVGTPAGWSSTEVPEGTLWVGLDDVGDLWAVGSRPSERIPGATREASAWRRRQPSDQWEQVPISFSFLDAFRIVRSGGYEAFRGVEAGISSAVFASECAWFMDDPSSFLYVWREGGRCTVQRLRDRQLARLDCDHAGTPRAFTTDGEEWQFDGRRFFPIGLVARLNRAFHSGKDETRTAQMAYSQRLIRGVITLWHGGHRTGHLTVASDDDGLSWKLGDRIQSNAPYRFIAGWIARTD